MAESKNNIITHGLSGKVGDLLVFIQKNGKTYVAKVAKTKTVEDSPKQKEHKLRFRKATMYAKSVLNDPDLKAMYAKKADHSKGMSIYNVAVADFFSAPQITSLDISAYQGKKGDLIKIIATDDFAVKSVWVKIESSDGDLIEEGEAADSGFEWIYTARINTPDITDLNITATATDYPDNVTHFTIVVE